jgi:formylglycine-generating enzyme required for sulfatase activity
MRSFLFSLCLCACAFLFADESSIQVLNVRTVPHWPWEGTVDVYYQVECDKEDADLVVSFAGYNADKDESVAMNPAYITGDGFEEGKPVVTGKELHAVWNAAADLPGYHCEDFAVIVTASYDDGENIYLVVDISGGNSATSYPYRYTSEAPDTTSDTCRTTELWLRKIPAGTFTMGSPAGETGRDSDETQFQVTLTQDYYIGVFECTQAQYQNIMGSNPSSYTGNTRPVEKVSYNTIRGTGSSAGAGWPTYGHTVDSSSFMGKLQTKTGLTFDLPTEAQWEYACRKRADGSCWTTALNSGKNLTGTSTCSNMAEVGRYYGNSSQSSSSDKKGGYDQHTKVGSYLPSELGLYDMHGNVWEWCLDWKDTYPTTAQTDYTGPSSGSSRVERGGGWSSYAQYCRAANRDSDAPSSNDSSSGFRVACVPAP